MNIVEIYWYSVLGTTLLLAFIFSAWAFSGGWENYMDRAADWADCDANGAMFVWGVGLFLGCIVVCFASFWALPLYFVVWLGYVVSKGARKRRDTVDTLKENSRDHRWY